MFWQIGPPDLDWLFDDLAQRSRKEDKRIALSAIVSVLLHEKRFDSELPRLRELVAGNESLLKADIALAAIHVAFGGKSGHAVLHRTCLLLTQSGHWPWST